MATFLDVCTLPYRLSNSVCDMASYYTSVSRDTTLPFSEALLNLTPRTRNNTTLDDFFKSDQSLLSLIDVHSKKNDEKILQEVASLRAADDIFNIRRHMQVWLNEPSCAFKSNRFAYSDEFRLSITLPSLFTSSNDATLTDPDEMLLGGVMARLRMSSRLLPWIERQRRTAFGHAVRLFAAKLDATDTLVEAGHQWQELEEAYVSLWEV